MRHRARGGRDHQPRLGLAGLQLEVDLPVRAGDQRRVARRPAAVLRDQAEGPAGRAGLGVPLETDLHERAAAGRNQFDLVEAVVGRGHPVVDPVMAEALVDGLDTPAVVRVGEEPGAVHGGDERHQRRAVAEVVGDRAGRVFADAPVELGLRDAGDPAVSLQRVLVAAGLVPDAVEHRQPVAVLDVLREHPVAVVVPAGAVVEVLRAQPPRQVTGGGRGQRLHRHELRAGLPEGACRRVGEAVSGAAQERVVLEHVSQLVGKPPGAGQCRPRIDVDHADRAVDRAAGGPRVQLGAVPGVRDDHDDLVLGEQAGLRRELHGVHVERIQALQLRDDAVRVEVVRRRRARRAGPGLLTPEQDEVVRLQAAARRPGDLAGLGPVGGDVDGLGGRGRRGLRRDQSADEQRQYH